MTDCECCKEEVGNLFDPDGAGLLVVDIQEKLWPHMTGRDQQLQYTLRAIEVAGHLEMPIIVTEQYVKGLGPTIPEVKAALDAFDAYHPIEKRSFSCFGENAVVDAVEGAGIVTLATVGIEAHVCVLQSALEALDCGLDVVFIAEACASRLDRHKEEAVWRVREAGAIVGSVEMFAFEALRTAAHPAFRKVQKVIL